MHVQYNVTEATRHRTVYSRFVYA